MFSFLRKIFKFSVKEENTTPPPVVVNNKTGEVVDQVVEQPTTVSPVQVVLDLEGVDLTKTTAPNDLVDQVEAELKVAAESQTKKIRKPRAAKAKAPTEKKVKKSVK